MTYASPAWEFAADTHLVKLQLLRNKVLRTIGNFSRRTPVRDLLMSFKIPYVYDFVTKLCRQRAEVIQNHDNENVRNIGQGEARHKKNCLLKEVMEGKIEGRIEVTRRRGRRRKKMLDDLGDRRGYFHFKEKALDRIKWRKSFGRDCGPVV
ncbi:hypothetical protein B7P43_G10448 [Cryptotermes secundus]|uniref:Uncharacterized protein n=1 Tax=Cryptotermes secundus TaxID=105785 RepID=A0A2J7RLA1_9NEOP|nr:hypothetical protein B7P43_G10448 [Cryptotermes secundus]